MLSKTSPTLSAQPLMAFSTSEALPAPEHTGEWHSLSRQETRQSRGRKHSRLKRMLWAPAATSRSFHRPHSSFPSRKHRCWTQTNARPLATAPRPPAKAAPRPLQPAPRPARKASPSNFRTGAGRRAQTECAKHTHHPAPSGSPAD